MDQNFHGKGASLSRARRTKQLESTSFRSLMGHYADSWQVTEFALGFAPDAQSSVCLQIWPSSEGHSH